MAKITLNIADENLQTVLTVLENLKDGLIQDMDVDKTSKTPRTSYKPRTNKVIYEDEQMSEATSGKYINAASFKKRMKK